MNDVIVDMINSIFVFGCCFLAIVNAFKIYKDKKIRGVEWKAWIFYSTMTAWEVVYYFQVGHWVSFFAAFGMVTATIAWTFLAFLYKKN